MLVERETEIRNLEETKPLFGTGLGRIDGRCFFKGLELELFKGLELEFFRLNFHSHSILLPMRRLYKNSSPLAFASSCTLLALCFSGTTFSAEGYIL